MKFQYQELHRLYPVSLIEAQAANKPIVSTRVGGIADILVEGETGLLSDVQDAEGFSNHLLSLVEDDALRMRLGENSSKYVMEKFSYQRLVRDMSGLYHELLEKKGKHALRKYFMPGLYVKFGGAIFIGLIYAYYYKCFYFFIAIAKHMINSF